MTADFNSWLSANIKNFSDVANTNIDSIRARALIGANLEQRIMEVEYALEHATVIDEKENDGKVSIGCQVELQYEDDDDTESYKIVGSQEADPFNNKISNESPIAAAIMGKKVGETVEVSSPDGVYSVKIVAIG